MAKLDCTFSQINAALSAVVNSGVSEADLVRLAGITVAAADINSVVTAFKNRVSLNETNAQEYNGILSPAEEEATIDISGYSFSNVVVVLIPFCDCDLYIKSCSTTQIVVGIGDARASELYQTGVKFQIIVNEQVQ